MSAQRRIFGPGLLIALALILVLADVCLRRPSATEVPATPTMALSVLPATPLPSVPTSTPVSAAPELILMTPTTRIPTATSTPTPTVTPTETPRPATPTAQVQRG